MQAMFLALMSAPDELRDELGREPTAPEVLARVRGMHLASGARTGAQGG